MNFVLTDSPTQEDIDVIHNGLIAYNLNYMDMRELKDLAVFYSDGQGTKLAGRGVWELDYPRQRINSMSIGSESLILRHTKLP